MNSPHKNARTTVHSRELIVRRRRRGAPGGADRRGIEDLDVDGVEMAQAIS